MPITLQYFYVAIFISQPWRVESVFDKMNGKREERLKTAVRRKWKWAEREKDE